MRPFDNLDLTPHDRFREVAALLAVGLLRHRDRAMTAPAPGQPVAPDNPGKTSDSGLELLGETGAQCPHGLTVAETPRKENNTWT